MASGGVGFSKLFTLPSPLEILAYATACGFRSFVILYGIIISSDYKISRADIDLKY